MPAMRDDARHVLLFFMDGVGLGAATAESNPLAAAALPHLDALLGSGWPFLAEGRQSTPRATVVATDANMGLPGRPQSATGQATILTGRNVPKLVGEHYGPKPNPAVAAVIEEGSLFREVAEAGGRAALLTPYPQGFFDAISSGKRLLSAVPLAASEAGLPLLTAADLRRGDAISPDFTNAGWREFLGYDDIPLLTPEEAGRHLATVARNYAFSFFEHWPTDRAGHRGSLAEAVGHMELIDAALGGLLAAWDDDRDLLIITSDHGNLEEKSHRQHTRNPVPTILVGPGHAELAAQIDDLSDIALVVRAFLRLPAPVPASPTT